MIQPQIFMDVDGTVINYWNRIFAVYYDACLHTNVCPLNEKDIYSKIRCGEKYVPSNQQHLIIPIMHNNIYHPIYLELDRAYDEMAEITNNLSAKYKTHLVTFHKGRKTLIDRLHLFGVNTKNLTIITLDDDKLYSLLQPNEKANMILSVLKERPEGYIIGDTQHEIIAGKELGLTTIAVTWGLRNEEFLSKYNPDFIINTPQQITEIIEGEK